MEANYWGLNKNIAQPIYAADLDRKCDRDSELGPPCVYNRKQAAKTVLLIGDSHAGHFSQALVDAAKGRDWRVVIWTHSGCHFQLQESANQDFSKSCLLANKKTLQWIVANEPELVILSQFIHRDSPQSELRNAARQIKKHASNLIVIENNPVFPDGKDFMISRPLIMPAYDPPIAFPISKMSQADEEASDIFARWSQGEGIFVMNIDDIFCDNQFCTRFKHNRWLYRDDDHLSVDGAKLLIPRFKQILDSK